MLLNIRISFGILFISVSFHSIVIAAECDPNLNPIANEKEKYTDRGNRCEGFYQSKVAFASLDLIGFAKGKLSYALDEEEVVHITVPLKPVNQIDIINVRAQAFPVKTYYRLDATMPVDGGLDWPIKDVLKPKGILSKNIGIFGWYKPKSGITVYVPLRADPKKSHVRNDDKFRLFFRSNIDVSDINYMWKYYKGGDLKKEKQYVPRIYRAGTPIVITAPEEVSGFCSLSVTALIKGRDSSINDNWIDRGIYLDIGGS